jgi:alcohol dehydrogenase
VVGLGGVGLSVLLGARLAGARQIIAVDLSDDKLAFATQLGATQPVNASSPDAAAEIKRLAGAGVDVAFEMAGSVPALELAYAATARGGMTVTAGLPHPDKRMTLSPLALVAEERTLKGSYVGSAAPQRDVPRMIALFRAGRLPVDALLTHRLKLEDINEGFDRLRDGIGVRQVVTF